MIIVFGDRRPASRSVEPSVRRAGQRLPLRESAIHTMPRDDARLAELPAEEDDVVARIVRKIYQAEVDILEDASEGLDLRRGGSHVGRERSLLRITLDDL